MAKPFFWLGHDDKDFESLLNFRENGVSAAGAKGDRTFRKSSGGDDVRGNFSAKLTSGGKKVKTYMQPVNNSTLLV